MDVLVAARIAGSLVVIGAVLVAFNALARLNLRRALGPPGPGNRLITVVETTQLPNAATLHVVRIGDAYAVIGRTAGNIVKVADLRQETVDAWFANRSRR